MVAMVSTWNEDDGIIGNIDWLCHHHNHLLLLHEIESERMETAWVTVLRGIVSANDGTIFKGTRDAELT